MKKSYQVIFSTILVLSMLLSACSRKQTNTGNNSRYSGDYYAAYDYDYEYEAMAEEAMAPMMDYAAGSSDIYESKAVPAAAAGQNTETAQKRMVKKSASINIQVMDPLTAAQEIIDLTENMGGFVISSSSSQEYYSGDIYLPRAELSIRVPSERLLEMLQFIESRTTDTAKYVSNKRIYGVDITSDYVDTQSRLTSLEKTRDKLYEIMDTAENAEEALEVYNKIAGIESDIEVYKGQIKYMEESVALSSIDIKINSIKPAPIQTVQKWNPGDAVKDAFESLLESGKDLIEWLIYFIIAVLPILALMALPVVLVVWLIRKAIRKNKAKKLSEPRAEKKDDALAEVKKQ